MISSSYIINNTIGDVQFIVQPQLVNGPGESKRSSDLYFIGQHHPDWGRYLSNSLYKLLENFACPASSNNPLMPQTSSEIGNVDSGINNPIPGQLWFNTSDNTIRVFTGMDWNVLQYLNRSETPPTKPKVGMLWYNVTDDQIYVWSVNNSWELIEGDYTLRDGSSVLTNEFDVGNNNILHIPDFPQHGLDLVNLSYLQDSISNNLNQALFENNANDILLLKSGGIMNDSASNSAYLEINTSSSGEHTLHIDTVDYNNDHRGGLLSFSPSGATPTVAWLYCEDSWPIINIGQSLSIYLINEFRSTDYNQSYTSLYLTPTFITSGTTHNGSDYLKWLMYDEGTIITEPNQYVTKDYVFQAVQNYTPPGSGNPTTVALRDLSPTNLPLYPPLIDDVYTYISTAFKGEKLSLEQLGDVNGTSAVNNVIKWDSSSNSWILGSMPPSDDTVIVNNLTEIGDVTLTGHVDNGYLMKIPDGNWKAKEINVDVAQQYDNGNSGFIVYSNGFVIQWGTEYFNTTVSGPFTYTDFTNNGIPLTKNVSLPIAVDVLYQSCCSLSEVDTSSISQSDNQHECWRSAGLNNNAISITSTLCSRVATSSSGLYDAKFKSHFAWIVYGHINT